MDAKYKDTFFILLLLHELYIYTGALLVGTPILGTHYIVSCDAEVCGAERESSKMIQERISPCCVSLVTRPLAKTLPTPW